MTPRPTTGRSLGVRACAKINLTLRVLGVRADGYHDIRTVFQSVALCDRLRFERSRGPFRISSDDPGCPTDRSNLVWQAADEVWRASGRRSRPSGVHVHIHKGIPARAGLGGGSSDAAVALRAFSALWSRRLEPDRLMAIAARLGADVPFFLVGGTALGVDRGDRLFPLVDRPTAWVVIAQPDVGVATAEAYRWLDADREVRSGRRRPARAGLGVALGPYGEGGNDFQGLVERRHPVVRQVATVLRSEWAAMSGSGSAVFGLFSSRPDAEIAAGRVSGLVRTTLVTRTLSAREYRRRSALRDLPGGEPFD